MQNEEVSDCGPDHLRIVVIKSNNTNKEIINKNYLLNGLKYLVKHGFVIYLEEPDCADLGNRIERLHHNL